MSTIDLQRQRILLDEYRACFERMARKPHISDYGPMVEEWLVAWIDWTAPVFASDCGNPGGMPINAINLATDILVR